MTATRPLRRRASASIIASGWKVSPPTNFRPTAEQHGYPRGVDLDGHRGGVQVRQIELAAPEWPRPCAGPPPTAPRRGGRPAASRRTGIIAVTKPMRHVGRESNLRFGRRGGHRRGRCWRSRGSAHFWTGRSRAVLALEGGGRFLVGLRLAPALTLDGDDPGVVDETVDEGGGSGVGEAGGPVAEGQAGGSRRRSRSRQRQCNSRPRKDVLR